MPWSCLESEYRWSGLTNFISINILFFWRFLFHVAHMFAVFGSRSIYWDYRKKIYFGSQIRLVEHEILCELWVDSQFYPYKYLMTVSTLSNEWTSISVWSRVQTCVAIGVTHPFFLNKKSHIRFSNTFSWNQKKKKNVKLAYD